MRLTIVPAEKLSNASYYAGGMMTLNPDRTEKPPARFSPIADGIESLITSMEYRVEYDRTKYEWHKAALQALKEQVFIIEAQLDAGLVDDNPIEQMQKYHAAVEAVTEILYDTEPAEVQI